MPLGDKNQNRIKGNIKKIIDGGGSEQDVGSYLQDEGYGSVEEFTSQKPADVPAAEFGEIRQRRKGEEALPGIQQFAGGLIGGAAGAMVGQPTVGAAIGGTVGRTKGILDVEESRMMREKPQAKKAIEAGRMLGVLAEVATGNPFIEDILSSAVTFANLDQETKKKLGKEVFKTGAIEAATGGVGKLASKAGSFVGKGVLGEVLGKRVAERGQERGWKALLDEKFYQDRVPKQIASKTGSFFKNLSNTTGKKVASAIKETSKDKATTINISNIKDQVKTFLPESGNPQDLLSDFASPAQKHRIKAITDKVLKLKGDKRKVESLWSLRKEIDNDIYRLSWSDDAMRYLQKLRGSLNTPIKSASPDIAEAFDRYAFVKESEDQLYKKFENITGLGETYAKNLEQFVGNLLSTNKDETIRMLKDLDKLNKADDKVIEDVLDMAAAEALDKGIPDISLIGKIAGGLFGGKKAIARAAATAQAPTVRTGARAVGRMVPVAVSESMEEEKGR